MSTENSNIKKILILQTAFIGDVILTLPLIQEVKEFFPNTEVHFVTIPVSKNIVETHPQISALHIFDKRGEDRGISGLFNFAAKLRKQSFDIALVPHRSLRSALLVYLAGIPRRIGFNQSAGFYLLTERVKYKQYIHESERNLHLLKAIRSEYSPAKVLPVISPDNEDIGIVSEWLYTNFKKEQNNIIALAPGSVWPTKRWPAEYWGTLADFLIEKKYQVVLIGGKKDEYLLDLIGSMMKNRGIKSAFGLFSLRQSAELIRRCRLLISNDSAPTHMGVAVKTPVLTIFGPTIPAFGFYPYGRFDRIAEKRDLNCRPCSIHGGNKCPRKHFRCMLELKPDLVFKIAMEMLSEDHKN